MHTCNNYSSCIGLLNLFGNDVRKKEKKNMRETILKRTKTCHESRIWEKLLNGEGGCNRNTDHITGKPTNQCCVAGKCD